MESPIREWLFRHSSGKRNNHPVLLQNLPPGHGLLLLVHGHHRLYLFQLLDLLVLFRLLLAFYLSPFNLQMLQVFMGYWVKIPVTVHRFRIQRLKEEIASLFHTLNHNPNLTQYDYD